MSKVIGDLERLKIAMVLANNRFGNFFKYIFKQLHEKVELCHKNVGHEAGNWVGKCFLKN